MISLSDNDAARRLRFTPLLSCSKFPAFSASKCLQNSSIIQNNSVTLQSVVISNVFVTCCNSPVKVQNICETTNFFMNYFLSRTGVDVPTEHPLLFCRYEPFLCLLCQHGEEDGLWCVATLPADCCRVLARAANGSPFPCRSARLLFRLSCSPYWHVVSMNSQMQSYEFFLKKLRE